MQWELPPCTAHPCTPLHTQAAALQVQLLAAAEGARGDLFRIGAHYSDPGGLDACGTCLLRGATHHSMCLEYMCWCVQVYDTTISTMLMCFCEAKTHTGRYNAVPEELEEYMEIQKQGATKKDEDPDAAADREAAESPKQADGL